MSIDIKAWRKANNYSQQDLADALGRHVITISKWETEARAAPDDLADKLAKLPTRRERGAGRRVQWFTLDFSVELDLATAKSQPYAWRYGDMNGNYALFSYGRQHLLWYNRERDSFLDHATAAFNGREPDLSQFNPSWLASLRRQMTTSATISPATPTQEPVSTAFDAAWDHAEQTGDYATLGKILHGDPKPS